MVQSITFVYELFSTFSTFDYNMMVFMACMFYQIFVYRKFHFTLIATKFLFKKIHAYQICHELTDKNVLQIVKISLDVNNRCNSQSTNILDFILLVRSDKKI